MASIRKRGVSWVADIRRKGHAPISKSFLTRPAAAAWARGIETQIDAAKYSDPRIIADLTIGALIDRYTAEVGAVKPFGKNKVFTLRILKQSLGAVKVGTFSPAIVVDHVRRRVAAGAGGVSVGIDLTYLAGVLKTARKLWGLPIDLQPVQFARDSLDSLGLSTRSNERSRRVTDTELELLEEHFNKKGSRQKLPMADIIRFAVATAMRLGEIMRIEWADLNVADRTIIIRDRKDPRQKIGNDQEVPLLGDAFDIVMRQPTGAKIFPFKEDTVSTVFPRAVHAVGLSDLHFHDLRHEGISRLFEQGYRIEQVALVSGHKDWKTLKRYTHPRAKDLHSLPHAAGQGAPPRP